MDKNMRKESRNLRRTLKSGAYTAAICAVLAAVLVFVNLITTVLPTSMMNIDLTADGVYTVGDVTKQLVSGISDKIEIFHMYEEGNEDSSLTKFLKRYEELNPNIVVSHVDPGVNPTFAKAYTSEAVYDNSLIVKGPKRTTVVHNVDMYQYLVEGQYLSYEEYYTYNQQIYTYYGTSLPYELYFSAEQVITSAIDYVTTDVIPVVYYTSKHGEMTIDAGYAKNIKAENIDLKELDLTTVAEIPSDARSIIINAPDIDFSKKETELLISYMRNGGSVILLTNFDSDVNKKLPNIASMCGTFGLTAVDGLLTEENPNLYFNSQFNTRPAINANSIVATGMKSTNVNVIMSLAHGITVDENSTYTITPILSSSDKAVIINTKPEDGADTPSVTEKTDETENATENVEDPGDETATSTGDNDVTDNETEVPDETAPVTGDNANEEPDSDDEFDRTEGKFHTGVHVVVTAADTSEIITNSGNFVWYSTNYLLTNESYYASSTGTGNPQMFSATINTLCGKEASVLIEGKALGAGYLTMTAATSFTWQVVIMIVLPAATLITGFVVWYKRRRK